MKKWGLICLGLALSACSFAIFPNTPEPGFQSVGRLGDVDGSNNFVNVASAVAIAPYWALTASHTYGGWFEQNGVRYQVLQKFTHVGSNGKNADLALLRLGAPVNFVTPILYRQFSGVGGLQGRTCKLVGCGATATMGRLGWTVVNSSSGPRRSAFNAIDMYMPNVAIDAGAGIKTSDYLVYDLDTIAAESLGPLGGGTVAGEGGIIVKDSGSGMFVQEGGVWYLVGINGLVGRLDSGTDSYAWGGIGLACTLEPYQSWIVSTVGP